MSLLDDARVVLFAHAHPDDETIATGSLILELVERGATVVLVTATRGERGEIVPAARRLIGDGEAALTAARERELHAAAQLLGVHQAHLLGTPPARAAGRSPRTYRDSGMRWIEPGLAGPASDVPPDALSRADLGEVVGDLRAVFDPTLIGAEVPGSVRPDLVISYDDNGGYGHPDHRRIREAALLTAHAEGVPFAELVAVPAPDVEWFELGGHLSRVQEALRSHASQLTVDGSHIIHSGGQREPVVTALGLRPVPGAGPA